MSDSPRVCACLRAKGAPGVVYDDAVSWEAGDYTSAVYWCTASADRVGPDDNYVHPHVCIAPRVCFTDARLHELLKSVQ